MSKRVLFIAFFLFLFVSYSQNKEIYYIDEASKSIDFSDYKKRLKSKMFFENIIENDSAIFKKLRFKEFYGKIDATQKTQVNSLFSKLYAIDSTKTWLIHYQDTLPDIKIEQKRLKTVHLDSMRPRKGLFNYEDDVKLIEKELAFYGKMENIILLHFFNTNNGYPIDNEGKEWYYDYSSILRKFFNVRLEPFYMCVIHPSGDFYVTPLVVTFPNQEKILDPVKFKKMKEKFEKKYRKI